MSNEDRTWVVERQWLVSAGTASQAIEKSQRAEHDHIRVYEKSDAPAVADEIRRLLNLLEVKTYNPEVSALVILTRKLVGTSPEDVP